MVEIGLFTGRPGLGSYSAEDVLLLDKRIIRAGRNTIILRKIKPSFSGVDPYNFRIDRVSDDNVKEVTEAPK